MMVWKISKTRQRFIGSNVGADDARALSGVQVNVLRVSATDFAFNADTLDRRRLHTAKRSVQRAAVGADNARQT
jgi:hypothetical protein